MNFQELLRIVGDEPVFESSLFLTGNVDPGNLRVQLSRWVKRGKLIQLRRSLYALAPPYQRVKPDPFYVANNLQRSSYISLQSALAYYSIIPEIFQVTTSVTLARPEHLDTPLGSFDFHHIQKKLFFGYSMTKLNSQQAFIAIPEKAILDLIYLQPESGQVGYIEELRLQNLELLRSDVLEKFCRKFNSPKISAATKKILMIIQAAPGEFEQL